MPTTILTDEYKKQRIEIAKAYAISKGGICLTEEYIRAHKKMEWKCHNPNHTSWKSTYNHVINRKQWCPECANQKFTDGLLRANEYATTMNGTCLSKNYIDSRTHLIWKCHNFEHRPWQSTLDATVNKQSWCPQCAQNISAKNHINPNGLEIANNYAKKHNGKCLSNEYINGNTKMIWKCSNKKHSVWKASYAIVIQKKAWCPECANSVNISENRTRLILETFFKTKFISCRPNWNKNPKTGCKLELDGYCDKLKLAFEHDGEHHFRAFSYGKKEKDGHFERQQQRDAAKKQNCIDNGVTLLNIKIPSLKDRKNFQAFLNHVIEECKTYGFNLSFTEKNIKKMEKEFYKI